MVHIVINLVGNASWHRRIWEPERAIVGQWPRRSDGAVLSRTLLSECAGMRTAVTNG